MSNFVDFSYTHSVMNLGVKSVLNFALIKARQRTMTFPIAGGGI